jgi:hypothetical protein
VDFGDVYEQGNFCLVTLIDLKPAERQKGRLVVERIEKPEEVLALAARVYEDLADEQIDSIEEHSRRRPQQL